MMASVIPDNTSYKVKPAMASFTICITRIDKNTFLPIFIFSFLSFSL